MFLFHMYSVHNVHIFYLFMKQNIHINVNQIHIKQSLDVKQNIKVKLFRKLTF